MTKASIPRGIPRQIMFHSDAMITGPTKGHTINIRNKGPCQINEARLVLEEKTGHTYYRIVAVDYDGSHYVAELPSEVLQFTGWSWSDTSIPFEIEIHPDLGSWHVVDLDSQEGYDILADCASSAVAKFRCEGHLVSDSVMVHPVYRMNLRLSGSRWLMSVRRILTLGNRSVGPLDDCFTHPDSFTCANGPLARLSRRDVLKFSQDLDDVLEKHIPGGIEWPVLGDGVLMCSNCFKPICRREPHSLGMECVCDGL